MPRYFIDEDETLSRALSRLDDDTTREAEDGRRGSALRALGAATFGFLNAYLAGEWRRGARGYIAAMFTGMHGTVREVKRAARRVSTPLFIAALALGSLSGTAQSEGRTLVVGMLSEPTTLNPLAVTSAEAHDILRRMFVKLADEQGDFISFEPRLATSWERSDDGLSLTFHLRDDVRWHDGEPVTAHDVRFTWELQTDTTVAYPSASDKEFIRDVEVIDDQTVVFHFTRAYLYQLTDANDGVILPKHLLENVPRDQLRTNAFSRAPVGNGPFEFSRWEAGRYIELTANPDYYEGAPRVERVLFRFVPDMVTLSASVKTGEVDLLEGVPADYLEAMKVADNVTLYSFPSRRINFIAWNLQHPLFADVEVRRALAYAVNREEIINTLWAGYAHPANGPVSPLLWAWTDDVELIAFDPTRTELILDERGWRDTDGDGYLDKDGKRFEFDLIVNNNQLRIDVATMVESQLRKAGIKVNIQVLEFSSYGDKLMKRTFDAAFIEIKCSTKMDITAYWHSAAIPPNGFNVFSYRNPKVDEWIDAAKASMDRQEAATMWADVQRTIYNEQPVMFLAVPDEVVALNSRFCGVEPNAISFLVNLRNWHLGEDCTAQH